MQDFDYNLYRKVEALGDDHSTFINGAPSNSPPPNNKNCFFLTRVHLDTAILMVN